jgi:hypothetical protein
MKRITLENTNLTPHFIGSWNLEPLELCDDIVNYFETNISHQKKGRAGNRLNQSVKKSVDITLLPNEIKLHKNQIFNLYLDALFTCYKDYLLQWPFLSSFANQVEIGSFNIQRYQAGEHFQQIQTERSSIATLHRMFAWMTYLNDVNIEGETDWKSQKLKVKPKIGLTVLWPPYWTHLHRGVISKKEEKIIITGWYSFI